MSLLEILAVLFIIALVSLVVVPGLTNFKPTAELNSAHAQIISNLREAQAKALETQINQTINFATLTYPKNITLESTTFPSDTFSWKADGLPTDSGVATLKASNGKTKTITITATGFIK
jgi:type II secretory pathway pseudopilin PulG